MLRLSLITLLFCCSSVYAQITITNNNMPSSGNSIEYSTAVSTSSVDIKTTGKSSTWDFTKLVSISDGVEEYKSSLQTPYVLNFGFSALGKKLADTLGFSDFQLKNIYNFYKKSSSSYSEIGIGFQFSAIPLPQSGKHSDPDEIYIFPLEFENKDSTTFHVEVPISAGFIRLGTFTRSGTRVTTVDGWGKISTPYLTNENCIRLKSVITETDSISVSTPSINFGTDIKLIEYKWLSTNEKIPVLTIVGNEVAGIFVPTSITYRNEWSAVTPIVVDFEADKTWTKKGNVVRFTNKSTGIGLSYSWSITPETSSIFVNGTSKNSENPKIVFQDTGKYSISLTVSSNSNSQTLDKLDYIRIADEFSSVMGLNKSNISVYPVPAQEVIHVTLPNPLDIFTLEVWDITGKVLESQTGEESIDLDILNWSRGTYYIRVSGNGQTYQTKVLID